MQLNVMFIDDSIEICELFSEMFSTNLIQIRTFTDSNLAIESASKNRPDVIFIDFHMAGVNGDKVAMAMEPSIPKYLISGHHGPKTAYKFDGFLEKPPNHREIELLLQTLLTAKVK